MYIFTFTNDMYINVSIYMYVYVYTYMWYGDRRFAVFTVSPMQMKHKKVRGRDRKERGTKEQESSSIKSLLKIAPQRHFGIL